jgi:protein-disulfide isomerase
MVRPIAVVLLLAALAGAQQKPVTHSAAKPATAAPVLPSEETVNAFMQQWLGYDPTLSWKVADIRPSKAAGLAEVTIVVSNPQGAQASTLYVSPDGTHALIGEILPFGARPFDATNDVLKKGTTGPAKGPADAPVLLVEFSDFECPHCKRAVPVLNQLLEAEPNVRFVSQNFPLPMHDWAAKAAAYADCVGRSSTDAFWKFSESVFNAQTEINSANAEEKLTALADQAGVKGADVAVCAAKPETITRVERSVALGKSVDVTATPTLFINGRKVVVGEVPLEALKQLVEYAAKTAK